MILRCAGHDVPGSSDLANTSAKGGMRKNLNAALNAMEEVEAKARLTRPTQKRRPPLLSPERVRDVVTALDGEWGT